MKVAKALTIAGSDSGGGAGIQADLKTFQEMKVFGTSVLTAVTAQNTLGVKDIQPITPEMVISQIDCVGEDIGTDSVKTGMLFSAEIIEAVSNRMNHYGWRPVVDPVMIAKGGAPLLQKEAIRALKEYLLPLALVITPNVPEAEALTGIRISAEKDKRKAAMLLHSLGSEIVVIKGGHDPVASHYAEDLFFDGNEFHSFKSKRMFTKNTHGTGCTFSAAITAGIANGLTPYEAVKTAKMFIQCAIENQLEIGNGHGPTNHFAYNRTGGSLRDET
ncbi:bifunctional hydroxymethylpyrimidine kinase/phosphomethylpyrimidine kinase [Bacillus massilinigeriensis]|uniref:bifunctional hydroxymethylpyrimidine kinase/phosphomethylpyrimidine kinase n=1 Tax=Bacillus mediterraneensis TaxID=1805474 RepID=UPI0008F82914|nr:bifunctional hydroxymethylpyrimidine kinase/phosphomethylpyrimidine kinase [Bacillus mediterraneensis]